MAWDERGDAARACAFRIVGAAFQLLPTWRSYKVPRGQYFGPLASGAFGNAPDMTLFDNKAAVAVLRERASRMRDPRRRARLADAAWEYGGHVDAARLAIDAYESFGAGWIGSEAEHLPMYGAAALARAAVLARTVSDETRTTRMRDRIDEAMRSLAGRDEHVALFILIEAALATSPALDALLGEADAALEQQYTRVAARDADNFNFQRGLLRLRRALAVKRSDGLAVRGLDRELAEAVVREAAWKGAHYDNGAFVEMHFLEEAAQRFEALGDQTRALELRGREREAFPRAKFQSHEHTVRFEAGPFRDWLKRALGSQENRTRMWSEVVPALPLPPRDEILAMQGDEQRELPFVASADLTTVTPEGITEIVSASAASFRRAQRFAYEYHGANMALLVKLAGEDYKVGARDAAAALVASGRFDDTSRALLDRMASAYDAGDWLTVGYLAGPLLERVTRRLAVMAQLETRSTERRLRSGEMLRRDYVPIEEVLSRLPLGGDLGAYVMWVVSRPGLNVRNEAAHGVLEKDRCHEVLGAHVLYCLLALAFTDLADVALE
jgi:hypothetical protein